MSAQRNSVSLYSLLERRYVAIDELTGENKHIANFAALNANFDVSFEFYGFKPLLTYENCQFYWSLAGTWHRSSFRLLFSFFSRDGTFPFGDPPM